MSVNISYEQQKNWNSFSRKIAREGIVLLRNDNNILPLKNEKVAVFGRTQINVLRINGHRNIEGDDKKNITEALLAGGVSVDTELYSIYENWNENNKISRYGEWSGSLPEMQLKEETVKTASQKNDKAIIVLGRNSSENHDMNVTEGGFLLSEEERDMINTVCHYFDSVILILNIACGIDLGFLDNNRIDGIIYLNHIGVWGTDALCDIIKGQVNPSGKLTLSLAKHYEDYSSSAHFGQHGGGVIQDYYEDIFVGYRWFDTFKKHVVFPFGHGLSYTKFEISDIKATITDKAEITAKITNVGNLDGKEVLQLYFSAPQTKDGAKLSKPLKELCGFTKTKLLAPNESEILTLCVGIKDMTSFDDTGVLGEKNTWMLEKGEYRLYIGTSSADITLAGIYTQNENEIVKKCYPITTTLPKRLTSNGNYEKLPFKPANPQKGLQIVAIGENIVDIKDNCSGKSVSNLEELKIDESISFRLIAGSAGKHILKFENIHDNNLSELMNISVDGVALSEEKISAHSTEMILPIVPCDVTITAKRQLPSISNLIIQKAEQKEIIDAEKENIIEAANMYEGSFTIGIDHFSDDGFGNSGSCITKMTRAGMYSLYKFEILESGKYDIKFNYAYSGETCRANDILAVFVSNIVRPLNKMILEKTYNAGERRIFKDTKAANITLDKGTVYFKIAAENMPFPDISKIIIKRNEHAIAEDFLEETSAERKQGNATARKLIDLGEYTPEGIQLIEVYKNPSFMDAFLNQLSNRELATLVSGTIHNVTPGGDVGSNHPLPARGVPATQTADGSEGLRQQFMNPTGYPAPIVLAASFDKELYRQYGEIMGEECNAYGVDLWLAPSINIFRNPCGGRNNVYASEDPYVSGKFAAEITKGVQKHGVAAVVKHYCANNTEYERLKSNSRVSAKALREIYIKGFEIAVKESNPWAIMSSYNSVNNTKACESYELITDIPRKEWGWDGAFFTDWWNDSKHVEELKAGHDLKMCTGDIDGVTAALDSGELTREQVKVCAERVLNMIMKTKRVNELFNK